MKHIAYLQPSLVPPPVDPQRDRFTLLSQHLSGVILQPVWFRKPAEIEAVFGPGSYPVFKRGNFSYHWFLASNYTGITARLMIFWFYIKTLLHLHKTEKPFDCIVAYSHLTTGLVGLLLKWLSGAGLSIEVVTSPHLLYITDSPNPGLKAHLRKLLSDVYLHITVLGCDCVHLLYPSQLAHYRRLHNHPAAVFHDFVPTSIIHRQPPAEERYILLVGAPWYLKGADLLVQAFTEISPEFPGIKLKIQGYFPELPQYTPPGGFGPGIEILKAVPNEITLPRIGQAHIFVLPSRCEGLARVLIEAMASGVATIGSDVGGTHWMVRDGVNGLLFPSGDLTALKQALRRLLSDEALRQQMGNAGFEIAHEKFSERVYVESFVALVDKATA